MARTPTPKPPSFAAELYEFAMNSAQVPYEQLAQHFQEAWKWRLVETDMIPMPDGTVLARYDLMIGREIDRLERLDTVTFRLNNKPGPVSIGARIALAESLIFLVFGRLPPSPAPAAQPNGEMKVDMSGGDVELPAEDDGGEYVDDTPAEALQLIARREPDGLPIFVDLYAMPNPTGEIIDALMVEVEGFLRTAETVEQIMAVANKNPDLIAFVKDLGEDSDRARLKGLFDEHKARIEMGPATPSPRRRTARAVPAN